MSARLRVDLQQMQHDVCLGLILFFASLLSFEVSKGGCAELDTNHQFVALKHTRALSQSSRAQFAAGHQ